MAARKKPTSEPVPERDWFDQMWDNLHAVAANAREANALPTDGVKVHTPARGQTILSRFRKPLHSS